MTEEHTEWDEALEANRRLWDAWTEVHEDSEFYAVDAFRAGETSLQSIELQHLGDAVAGRRLLHLQCHFGLDTLSWARLGADVVGVDLSPKAIRLARTLAEELDIPACFIESDVLDLRSRLDDTFDIVYTSYGVLDWLSDLDRWARVVADSLVPGGTFFMVEFHPLAGLLGDNGRTLEHPYFPRREPLRFEEKGSYADTEAPVEGESVVWPHSLSEIFMALLGAGLRLDAFHEYAESPYDCFPFTKEVEPGRAVIPNLEHSVPLVYSLRATKV